MQTNKNEENISQSTARMYGALDVYVFNKVEAPSNRMCAGSGLDVCDVQSNYVMQTKMGMHNGFFKPVQAIQKDIQKEQVPAQFIQSKL